MVKIDLNKRAEKVKIELEKKKMLNEKAQVVVVMDISASMSNLYNNGTVQELTERLLALGLNMDDNKTIDMFTFGEQAKEVDEVTSNNYEGYVDRMIRKNSFEYGTRYGAAMDKVIKKYSAKKGLFKSATATVPTFVIFVTDGDNSDKPLAEKLMKESSNQAIFWQFVGVGREKFSFLKKLDDMDGRFLDNADFFSIPDINDVSDEVLYQMLLTEFPEWIKQARAKGILK